MTEVAENNADDVEFRRRTSPAALRTVAQIAEHCGITSAQLLQLLDLNTWPTDISQHILLTDQLYRAGLLINIYTLALELFGAESGKRWITCPHAIVGTQGRPPLDLCLSGGTATLCDVVTYLQVEQVRQPSPYPVHASPDEGSDRDPC